MRRDRGSRGTPAFQVLAASRGPIDASLAVVSIDTRVDSTDTGAPPSRVVRRRKGIRGGGLWVSFDCTSQ